MPSSNFSANPTHVAKLDRAKYFGQFLRSKKAENFVIDILENESERKAIKIVNSAGRLSWIADKTETFAKGRCAFQIMYYTIIAESSAKLEDDFNGTGKSKKYVLGFFNKFTTHDSDSILANAFSTSITKDFLDIEKAVELLYNIRCDLAHEGKYFDFFLKETKDSTPVLNSRIKPKIISHITLEQLKGVVLSGVLKATLSSVKTDAIRQKYKQEFL